MLLLVRPASGGTFTATSTYIAPSNPVDSGYALITPLLASRLLKSTMTPHVGRRITAPTRSTDPRSRVTASWLPVSRYQGFGLKRGEPQGHVFNKPCSMCLS